jgi:glycosyltransferase involved in cell wall biosynthesis
MKILHVMASRVPGGAETYSTDVMLSLHAAGVGQVIVMPRTAPRFAELEAAGLRMAPEIFDWPFRFIQRQRLRRLVKQEKPDLIHCWMRRAASLVPPGRIPIIGWFGGYYEPKHFRRCMHFVGVTQDIIAYMIKNGVPFGRAHYIPTFPDIADLPAVDRAALATPKDAKVLLTLSRLHPKKGLDVMLAALKDLPDCVLWMAGDGPLKQALEKQAAQLGVASRVRFLGWRTDRAALLRAADVCVLPSRYEPFGTVILEAWAMRVPFVAAASAGPAATVTDGVNGLLVPIDDAAALTQALRRALDDVALRARMTAAGYEAYTASFTREAVMRQWLDFYRRIAG